MTFNTRQIVNCYAKLHQMNSISFETIKTVKDVPISNLNSIFYCNLIFEIHLFQLDSLKPSIASKIPQQELEFNFLFQPNFLNSPILI